MNKEIFMVSIWNSWINEQLFIFLLRWRRYKNDDYAIKFTGEVKKHEEINAFFLSHDLKKNYKYTK